MLDPEDRFEDHIEDTLKAGGQLCDPAVVEMVVREAPARINELIEWGTNFDKDSGTLTLGREGGHSHHRIVHWATTIAAIMNPTNEVNTHCGPRVKYGGSATKRPTTDIVAISACHRGSGSHCVASFTLRVAGDADWPRASGSSHG